MLSILIKSLSGRAVAQADGVYVCLMGGLGNQLFQLACARFLVAQGIAVSGLLTNLFESDGYARRPLVDALSSIPLTALPKASLASFTVLAEENGMTLLDALRQRTSGGTVCRGYWQETTFADACASELVAAFTRHGGDARAGSADDCVVHVRRGDYGHHGLLPLAYYQAALESAGWPRFSVVTDEPNYCEHVFSRVRGYAGVIRGANADPWSDFYRMSRARLQIVANSSYSWWAAWLGTNTAATARVIAPAEWSLLAASNPCPPAWHRIDTKLLRP